MNISSKQIIILIVLSIVISVNGRIRHSNKKNSFDEMCNNIAINKTNGYEIYNCLNGNNNIDCKTLENYNDFILIRNECIKDYNIHYSKAILIVLFIWIMLGFICN